MRHWSVTAALLCALILPAPALSEAAKTLRDLPPARKPTPLESYVLVDPVMVSIVAENRTRGILVVEFGLNVPDGTLREEVPIRERRLRDGYVRTLTLYASSSLRPGRPPDVEAIATRLQRVTDSVLEQQGAQVLLMQVMVRNMR
ncbi:MAG: hypothetical protein HXY22_08840 [Alphaproteobacteria bacterium]|nr:hypothetical protein [Alphaproteobacteria bacterium]